MQVKALLKAKVARLVSKFLRPSHKRIVILCYHSIHPSKAFSSATPELFEEHLRWLRVHSELLPLNQALSAARDSRAEGTKPIVAITFDDGYADNYEYALPLLQKYGVPATFFVTVGLLEKDPVVLERFQTLRQSQLEDIRPLTWAQVREMRRAGMDIGSHTYSHPNLVRLNRNETELELRKSKAIIEKRLGGAITLLAYPFGKPRRHFSRLTVEVAEEVGYQYGVAVTFRAVRTSDSPLALPRFFVTRDDIETLAQKIYGVYDWLGWWQQNAPLWMAAIVSREDFEV